MKQLDTLYKYIYIYITSKTYSVSLYDKLFRNLNNTMSNSAIIYSNSVVSQNLK